MTMSIQQNLKNQQMAKQQPDAIQQISQKSVAALMNATLGASGYKKRFEELLGKRSAQFTSSLVTLINATPDLQQAFMQNPNEVIVCGLKAATYDLPIEPGLGYAYIVVYKDYKNRGGSPVPTFIIGYKGMIQLALRTGVYKTINVTDVREGELKSFNRLTEDIEIEFIEDEEVREATPIIGYVGYFRMVNGTEKTVYKTVKQINAHRDKFSKAKTGFGWANNYEAMAKKTILRELLGKWGLLSIDYQRADASTIAAADAIAKGTFDDEDDSTIDADYTINSAEDQAILADLDAELAAEAEKDMEE